MSSVRTLRRESRAARERWQLAAIACCATSPENARRTARRMGWSVEDARAAAALARIYFEHGEDAFERELSRPYPDFDDRFCFGAGHRARPDECCDVFAHVCFCACHYRKEYDWFRNAADAEFSDACDHVHTNVKPCSGCAFVHRLRREECCPWAYSEEPAVSTPADAAPPPRPVVTTPLVADVQDDAPTADARVSRIARRLTAAGGGFRGPFRTVQEVGGSRVQAAANYEHGAVLVTNALAERLTDDELAWVVAHEIAHFEHRDHDRTKAFVDRRVRQAEEDLRAVDERLKAKGRGVIVRGLAQLTHAAAHGIAIRSEALDTSREHETEADRRAIDLMDRAGYDPAAAEAAYRKLHGGSLPSVGIVEAFRSTHPLPRARAADLRRQAAETRRR